MDRDDFTSRASLTTPVSFSLDVVFWRPACITSSAFGAGSLFDLHSPRLLDDACVDSSVFAQSLVFWRCFSGQTGLSCSRHGYLGLDGHCQLVLRFAYGILENKECAHVAFRSDFVIGESIVPDTLFCHRCTNIIST